jgi:hypothetical protein
MYVELWNWSRDECEETAEHAATFSLLMAIDWSVLESQQLVSMSE